jgi:hypothetical protein
MGILALVYQNVFCKDDLLSDNCSPTISMEESSSTGYTLAFLARRVSESIQATG